MVIAFKTIEGRQQSIYMMTTAAVIGLSAGKRLLSSSFYHSDITEKFPCVNDHGSTYHQASSIKNVIVARKLSNCGPNYAPSGRKTNPVTALKEHVDTVSASAAVQSQFPKSDHLEEESPKLDHSIEALLLLQKSMLEKQWNLSFRQDLLIDHSEREDMHTNIPVTCSGVSARQRRMIAKRKLLNKNVTTNQRIQISPELLQNRPKGYVRGVVSKDLLPHAEVVRLSKKIKVGLALDEHRSRLKVRLGCDPSEDQLASSLKISRGELHSKLLECSLAREKLVMSNVRLVMSIAQRYENMGVEMADLVQGGLIGLLRGIEKFDSSKGFRISTYVYWWIRQGVSRTLIENCRTLRLPVYMHERLAAIRKAKAQLEQRGLTPSINRIAQHLNISQRKVRNATEVISKVLSLDREAFPSLNGLPGATHHSYIADNRPEYITWNGVHEWMLKDEVNRLIDMTLGEREREIIRLYHGLEGECLTWEEISKRIGLSRERVRQVGLVSMEKLKHAARNKKMEALLLLY